MNGPNQQPSDPSAELDYLILLHSTNELPEAEAAALAQKLDTNASAAAFAQRVDQLPLAAKAPRDFAAVAIATAPRDFAATAIALAPAAAPTPSSSILQFPLRKYATSLAATAAIVAIAFTLFNNRTGKSEHPATEITRTTSAEPTRITAQISRRLDALETELTQSRLGIGRGRYSHSPVF